MADLMGIGSIFNAISNSISSGLNYAQQKKFNEQQQKNWQTQFDYTKWLNDTQMQREDTAVQRSVADYQAAGFNKLLAVGQPAQTGTLTSFQGNAGGKAATLDEIKNPLETALELMQAKSNMNLTEAETKLKQEQATTEGEKRNMYNAMEGLYKIQTAKTKTERETSVINYLRAWNDYLIEAKNGIKTNDSNTVNNPWQAGWRLLNQAGTGMKGANTFDVLNLDNTEKNKNNFLNFLKEHGIGTEESRLENWNMIQKGRK